MRWPICRPRPGESTGTRIQSDKPIAVFSGNNCANVPTGVSYCDHIVEQLTPTSAWGRRFVTTPLASRQNGDTFRFLAATDGTTVRVDGETVATLDAGQYHEQILTDASVIEATSPILVAQFANGSALSGNPGDPFMMLVPPYEQFLSSYTVAAPSEGFEQSYINITAPGTGAGITLDGVAVPPTAFTAIGTSGYSAAAVPVDPGTHRLTGLQPFGVAIYGFNADDSYGYTGGLSASSVATVIRVGLAPKTGSSLVGATTCVTGTATNSSSGPVAGVRMDFVVTGANPTSGFATTNSAGEAEYCYSGAEVGTDTVTGTVSGISDSATRTWQATPPPNVRPVAQAVTVSTTRDVPVPVVLAATDADGDPVTYAVATPPQHGALSGTAPNLTYTPAAGYTGADSFTYTASDAGGASAPATVSITVAAPANRAPSATAQSVSTPEDTAVPVVLSGTDPDGDVLTFAVGSQPAHGTMSGSGANLTYTPEANYSGPDSFTFTVNDGTVSSAPATVSITVTSVNDGPSAIDDVSSTVGTAPVTVGVLVNDSDPDGGTLSVTANSSPANGSVLCGPSACTYTANDGFVGTDSFTYTVSDGQGGTATATVRVTVTAAPPVNVRPVAQDISISTIRGVPAPVVLVAVDPEGDPLTYAVVSAPLHGSLSGSGASLTYTPAAGYIGPDSFTYTASDAGGASAPATVTITVAAPANLGPVAVDDVSSTVGTAPVTVGVLVNDSDPDGGTLSVTANSSPANGSVLCGPSACTYTANDGFVGTDSFTYTISDGQGGTATATVRVTVTAAPPVNVRPVAQALTVATLQGAPVAVTLSATDADGDPVTYSIGTPPSHGTLTGTAPNLMYTPAAGYSGPDSFTYTASDAGGASAPATVGITVTPVAPPVCPSIAPSVDASVDADVKPGGDFTSPRISTSGGGRLLLAFVEADGPSAPTQTVRKVTGGGLTWTLAARSNSTWGTTEVWQAYATGPVSSARITAQLAKGGFGGSITVAAFRDSASTVGAVGTGAGTSATASATLRPTACGSLVWAAAHDWSRAKDPAPVAGQTVEHKYLDRKIGDAYWVQRLIAPTDEARTPVTVSAGVGSKDRWTIAAVEIVGASPAQ